MWVDLMKFIVAIFLGLSLAMSSQAVNVGSAKITELRSGAIYGEKIVFKVSTSPAPEACNTLSDKGLGDFVLDLSEPGAYALFAMIASAKKDQSDVQIWGTKNCIDIYDGVKGETVEAIAIK